MTLIWAVLIRTSKENNEWECARRAEMNYPDALMEMKSAIENKYELHSIAVKNENCAMIVFIKYDANKKILHAFYIAGNGEEINRLQLDLNTGSK